MDGPVVLITGGNAGVGKATARALAARGARVIITSRDEARGRAACEDLADAGPHPVRAEVLDLGSFRSIHALARRVSEPHPALDVLINNAGAILGRRQETEQGYEATFGINHLGHFLLTRLLMPGLRRAPAGRIVVVASQAHRRVRGLDFDDLQRRRRYRSLQVYSESKLANLLHVRALARRLSGESVTVNAVHPGRVASRFARDGDAGLLVTAAYALGAPFLRTPEQGARASVRAALDPELAGVSGRYYGEEGEVEPWPWARDDDAAERLWRLSEELVNRHPGPWTEPELAG